MSVIEKFAAALGGLRDQFGKPVKRGDLERSHAGPLMGGARPVISEHPADGLTPVRLSMIHREAASGEPLSYLELAEDIEERDLHYAGVIATRKRAASQLPITVEPASDAAEHQKHADFVQSWINDDVLSASMFDALDAIGKGFSVLEIDWKLHGGHMCPRDLTWRPQRWFTFDQADGETVLLRDLVEQGPLPPHKFLIHRHKAKSGLTIRSGVARIASWAWMYKAFTLRDWSLFVQNFGQPIRLGRYNENATDAEKDVLWRAVSRIAGDCAAILPEGMPLEFVEVKDKGSSTDMYERRADWFDKQISKLILGQTTTTDAVSGGHAVAREHRLVQEDIERADGIMLAGSINRQMIPNLVAFNFGEQSHYPKIRIGRPDEVPLKDFAEAFDKLARHGLTAPANYMRGRLSIPPIAGDEEVIGGRQATTPAPEEAKPEPQCAFGKALFSRQQSSQTEQAIESLTRRVQEDAAGALAGLTGEIRAALEEATDLADAAERMSKLKLSPDALAEAMSRGMALAHLAGQAALLGDLERRK